MSIETVRGTTVIVHFEGERCIHSRHCVLDRPDVFVPNVKGEWIHPDRATPHELQTLARNCPSGAIRCEMVDGSAAEAAPPVNLLQLRENGPLAIHAPLSLNGRDEGLRRTLCRCGASARKPWCDNSHSRVGFVASGEVATRESQPLAQRDGPLALLPVLNGPLHLVGNLEIVSGTGRTVDRVSETWLCRCGQSKNKPYCDGSHKAAGFNSDGA
ncbi:CDGSH iron-sulfur domain-containing protein [Rivibacter subsaxonicus]|uniref:Putative Fe-S cluster protein YjdI n=1 Tax=Rivibacter subsaxonicus TaxID=457575 RepID=A0A4Q7VWA5_9BURK|nr:CDGSH iron-sulfur domain-containing protein [Rivibacter subsaxonicus]RZU00940.1 putative Fe-S cluster protein YjdI [Rivibacter subsaxonicus]